jgi:steroid 5-alpha reductase family enzyme
VVTYDYRFSDFLLVSAVCLAVVVALMAVTAVLARVSGRVSVVDTVWGPGFVLVTLAAVVVGRARNDRHAVYGAGTSLGSVQRSYDHLRDQQHLRGWLLVVLVAAWGGRLAWHIGRRSRGHGEDPRYERLLAEGSGGIVRKVLLPQGAAIWFVSLPIQVTVVAGGHFTWVLVLGVLLWLVGLVFESAGDAQLAAYKRDPERGPVMDRGLWRYTRHPNYFGDACVWWGVFLVCASAWPGVLTILSPVAMTYFLVFATGAKLLERTMMERPGYPEYAARTSMFVPLPPRRG